MSHYARKVDTNQQEIVDALRRAGAWVWSTAALGRGAPDLLVWAAGHWTWLELKDGRKPPSARKLTPLEAKFHAECPGPIHVVLCPEDALLAVGIHAKGNR